MQQKDITTEGRCTIVLGEFLPEDVGSCMKQQFYARYNFTFSAGLEPGDVLLSRITDELDRRLIQVHRVWKVCFLTHQIHSEPKRTMLAGGFEFSSSRLDETMHVEHIAQHDSRDLHTLMIGYARACLDKVDAQLKYADGVPLEEVRTAGSIEARMCV